MINRPPECEKCIMFPQSRGFMQHEGSGVRKILFVAESAGDHEFSQSLPLRPDAPAGSVFNRALEMAGISRQSVLIDNLLRCQPLKPKNALGGMWYEDQAITYCTSHHLDQVVEKYKPKVIVALGNVAIKHLTGFTGSKEQQVGYLRGYILPCIKYPGVLVVCSFHPSYLRIGAMENLDVVRHDYELAKNLAEGKLVEGEDYMLNPLYDVKQNLAYNYQGFASYDMARSFEQQVIDNPNLLLTYDLETPRSIDITADDELVVEGEEHIEQINFSLYPKQGIVFPGSPEFMTIAKRIMALPNPKGNHNCTWFDDLVLESHGFTINTHDGLPPYDPMVMWRILQPDLAAHLQAVMSFFKWPFPWKHMMGSNIEFYGCADSDAPQRSIPGILASLKAQNLIDAYEKLTRPFWTILRRITVRGMPINGVKLETFGEEIDKVKTDTFEKVQTLVPQEIKGKHPKVGYKVVPREIRDRELDGGVQLDDEAAMTKLGSSLAASVNGILRKGIFIEEKNEYKFEVERYYVEKFFLPTSKDQVLAYIKSRGHKVPLAYKSDNPTTNATSLQELFDRTGDEGYELFIDYRELSKMRSQYCGNDATHTKGFRPSSDGRIRAYFTFKSTLQLATTGGPPILTRPKHGDLAKSFLGCFEPSMGHRFVEFDFSGFHSALIGRESLDREYIRLSQLGIHDYLTARIKKIPGSDYWLELPDEELSIRLKEVKKEHEWFRNAIAKRVVHGFQNGLGKRRMYYNYRKFLDSEAQAGRLLAAFADTFPRVPQYQQRVRVEANLKHFLRSDWNTIRWFWDVAKWNHKKQQLDPGSDWNEVPAYYPHVDANCMLREKIFMVAKEGLDEKCKLILPFHDALIFECPRGADSLLDDIYRIMSAPCSTLKNSVTDPEGFKCGIDVKVSKEGDKGNWNEMEDLKL